MSHLYTDLGFGHAPPEIETWLASRLLRMYALDQKRTDLARILAADILTLTALRLPEETEQPTILRSDLRSRMRATADQVITTARASRAQTRDARRLSSGYVNPYTHDSLPGIWLGPYLAYEVGPNVPGLPLTQWIISGTYGVPNDEAISLVMFKHHHLTDEFQFEIGILKRTQDEHGYGSELVTEPEFKEFDGEQVITNLSLAQTRITLDGIIRQYQKK